MDLLMDNPTDYNIISEDHVTTLAYPDYSHIISFKLINVTIDNPEHSHANFSYEYLMRGSGQGHDTDNLTRERTTVQKSAVAEPCLVYRFIFYTLIVGICCLFGIVGNIVSMLVLKRVSHNNPVATFLLQALAVSDNLVLGITFIALSITYGMMPLFMDDRSTFNTAAIVVKYLQPCAYMSHTSTIWLTVLLAINRYYAICRPLESRHLCTIRKARLQVALVFAFSVVYNIPRFFQYYLKSTYLDKTDLNSTVLVAMPSKIGETSIFGIIYTNATYSLVVVLLPLFFLIFLNTKLIRELGKMKTVRSSMSSNQPIRCDNINLIMIVIIIVLIVCHFPDRIIQVVRIFVTYENFACFKPLYFLFGMTSLLIILNSSTNFVIYFFLSRSFRKALNNKFCPVKYSVNGTELSLEEYRSKFVTEPSSTLVKTKHIIANV